MPSRLATCAVYAALLTPHAAHADGLDLDVSSPRAIGRAGAVVVSSDGGDALVINPAGTVRRGGYRVQVGTALHDSDTRYRAGGDSPEVRDQAGPVRAPAVAVLGAYDRWVFGAAYLETGDLARSYARPAFSQPPADIQRLFPHRYGGLDTRYRRHTIAAGVAVRAGDSLGLGLSVRADHVDLDETRHLWAGFDGRDAVGDPARDMVLRVRGRDWFVPGVAAGALYAPEAPFELAVSATWSMDAELSGTPELETATDGGPTAELIGPRSRTTLASPLTVRAGARYLGERFYLEVAGEAHWFAGTEPDPVWQLEGVTAVDSTGAEGELSTVRSIVDRRTYGAARGAVDVEVVRGFLWLTGGYAFTWRGQRLDRLVPGHVDLGGHTVAAGAEAQWEQLTFTVGYARTLGRDHTVTDSTISLVNPFAAGTATTANGRYEAAHDAFAASVEIAWE